jgi:hypothetical protein
MPVQGFSANVLESRYGRVHKHRVREGWIIAGFAAAALAVFLVWALGVNGIGGRASTLTSTLTGTSISQDGMRVTVHYTVNVTPGTAYNCAIEAQDENHAIVGWKVVSSPGVPSAGSAHQETIRTVQPAVAGLIYDCWLD